jgi:Tfp pilus assembly protein PilF
VSRFAAFVFAAVLVAAAPGCSSQTVREVQAKLKEFVQLAKGKAPSGPELSKAKAHSLKAQALLAVGLKLYEEGEYADSEVSLQSALYQGLPPRDQVVAHKHLAFMHCAADRKPECRTEFQRALSVDPAMNLEPAEAGHPGWGPVFQSVRARR